MKSLLCLWRPRSTLRLSLTVRSKDTRLHWSAPLVSPWRVIGSSDWVRRWIGSVSVSGFCPDDSFWTAQPLVTKLEMVVLNHEPEYYARKIGSQIFKVTVTGRAHKSKYDRFYCIFLTADPFTTELGLIVHYHKPEYFMEKLDCCGQGHSKISKCQWMFIQMIFSESLNLLLPNLVI